MTAARQMGLGALTDEISPDRVVGIPVGQVRALAYDSRRVAAGTLFFAVPGMHADGHDFVRAAVEAGAIGVVVERELADLEVPQLIVDRSRRALADAAHAWFVRPSDHLLRIIGVTGTDGKSTVTNLAAAMLWDCGWHPGQVGTVSVRIGDDLVPNTDRTTTPESLELQELLYRMVGAGNDSVVMEATSHGLALERTRNCRFDIGVVTTVTSEHLEFHGTLEAYRAAKARLVEEAPIAILNADDDAYAYFRDRARARIITYGTEADADLQAGDLEPDAAGTTFHLEAPSWHGKVRVPMPGRFNVMNALATLAVADAMEIDLGRAADALARSDGVPGRMQHVDAGQPFRAIVDYAHTVDSLRKVLELLRPLVDRRLIVVFGSAGERDTTKRAPMGAVAAELADIVIVTDEDPRLEDPRVINEQIADGARAAGGTDGESLFVIDDRQEAIGHAIGLARGGDVILLAGKGHEQSMIYGTEMRTWDDASAVRSALGAAGWGR